MSLPIPKKTEYIPFPIMCKCEIIKNIDKVCEEQQIFMSQKNIIISYLYHQKNWGCYDVPAIHLRKVPFTVNSNTLSI